MDSYDELVQEVGEELGLMVLGMKILYDELRSRPELDPVVLRRCVVSACEALVSLGQGDAGKDGTRHDDADITITKG